MQKCLFAILFFPGVIPVLLPIYRVHLIQQARNWTDAQTYCRENFDDLATIGNGVDIMKFQEESLSHQFISNAWIGLHREKTGWYWSLADEPLGAVVQWNPAALSTGNRECAIISYYAGWWDEFCSMYYSFICFDDRYTDNNMYILINTLMTWHEAQSYCRQHHTDMASSRTSAENSIILNKMAGLASYIWIGLFRYPWTWSDQTTFSPITWMPGKPDNIQGNEDCIYLYNGQAADAQCSELMPFFCYKIWHPRKQQTIKMKVRSTQDVNDPAVQEAILEKIKQKVKEHGLANIMMKWREQPHGPVFHKMRMTMTTVTECNP